MEYHGPKEESNAAHSLFTSPEELAELADSEYVFVRVAVAENPHTPIQILSRLIPAELCNKTNWKIDNKKWAIDKDSWEIVRGLLHNPNLPRELFIKITEILKPTLPGISPRDYEPNVVVEALAESNLAPPEALLVLSDASIVPKHIRRRIANPKSADVLLEQLTNDSSETVRKRAINALRKRSLNIEE